MTLSLLLDLLADDEGGAMVEYGLIAAVAAIPMILALGGLIYVLEQVLSTTGTGLSGVGLNP
ncbi:MAG: hypothetical protein M3R35_05935 [Candidatus Eremiobacteraeota bacterium]|nr:hypothetical protein [Candidatus Eremiobacteraeota bacterium]